MKRYIKASGNLNRDIIVTYRNKILYDGPITAEPTEIFKNIRNFNPENNSEDRFLVGAFERSRNTTLGLWDECAYISYRNAEVRIYDKRYFDQSYITPKEKPDPNTAVVDGERMTAEEIADDIMLEADNYEYLYNGYQSRLADYAKKVVENGWENTWRDKVTKSGAIGYVVEAYVDIHSTRKELKPLCGKFIAEAMQDDYNRYKAEYQESLNNEESNL
jgi:hypothetical protein